ncbi:light-regulated signal transduction histidine kinase (bacteriophytochrome) [Povalibacter uvarum]|uniref:histidine kinase n=1 Tax=Povalibacter uvarum TaxID=732238 RepID=A0A841HJQ3_9GAMM|nr:ATP-binding protein [Povalibacter uvarum]MBB6092953.1 light-regulated signal transduction histidine kinase (bacteriophytochrome) [Povalibacter uvarum]
MSSVLKTQLPLDTCAQEPIRIPGTIQPHGALIVCHPQSLTVLQASVNCSEILGCDAHIIDRPLREIFGASLAEEVRRWLDSQDITLLRTTSSGAKTLQVLGHRTAQGIILEFEEPPATENETIGALYPRIGRFMDQLQDLSGIQEACAVAAREFRRVSGFNRILIYRFDAEWNGEVLAEDSDGVLPSYLGLRFPASDIPAQARELYRTNRLRLIPDANYTPVPVHPSANPLDKASLDLSLAALRSVSPVHLQYMRNMGTLASMSISILVEGRLWGLVSCHNAQPRRVNAQMRTACDLLGTMLSHQIASREHSSYAADRIRLKHLEAQLLVHLTTAESPSRALASQGRLWMNLTDAAGAAVITGNEVFASGETPSGDRLRSLADWIETQHGGDQFVTANLGQQQPEFADIADVASGVLAVSISQLHRSFILWFRPEVVRTVHWAGDPQKAVPSTTEPLRPRHSFASWAEQQRLRAEPWSRAHIDAALDFRSAMINIVLRRAEEHAALTSQLQRTNRELESFSYSISHDLRAPFRHIVGYTQLLRDREKNLSEKAQHYLESINEAAATAGQLVDDLLSFSHLGRTSLAHGNVDMNKLLQEVLRTVEPDIRERQVVWQLERLPSAWGDAAMLRQALVNLIGNAIKYSRDRTPATISVRGDGNERECIYEVRDNGVGFDMRYVHKLFGVFQRLHRMEDFEGTGIGLALTKRIVERHGGWISAEGEVDRGACFRFAIPSRKES